jgi:hypothetical protein
MEAAVSVLKYFPAESEEKEEETELFEPTREQNSNS